MLFKVAHALAHMCVSAMGLSDVQLAMLALGACVSAIVALCAACACLLTVQLNAVNYPSRNKTVACICHVCM